MISQTNNINKKMDNKKLNKKKQFCTNHFQSRQLKLLETTNAMITKRLGK